MSKSNTVELASVLTVDVEAVNGFAVCFIWWLWFWEKAAECTEVADEKSKFFCSSLGIGFDDELCKLAFALSEKQLEILGNFTASLTISIDISVFSFWAFTACCCLFGSVFRVLNVANCLTVIILLPLHICNCWLESVDGLSVAGLSKEVQDFVLDEVSWELSSLSFNKVTDSELFSCLVAGGSSSSSSNRSTISLTSKLFLFVFSVLHNCPETDNFWASRLLGLILSSCFSFVFVKFISTNFFWLSESILW